MAFELKVRELSGEKAGGTDFGANKKQRSNNSHTRPTLTARSPVPKE